jgi:hypothetical protein
MGINWLVISRKIVIVMIVFPNISINLPGLGKLSALEEKTKQISYNPILALPK